MFASLFKRRASGKGRDDERRPLLPKIIQVASGQVQQNSGSEQSGSGDEEESDYNGPANAPLLPIFSSVHLGRPDPEESREKQTILIIGQIEFQSITYSIVYVCSSYKNARLPCLGTNFGLLRSLSFSSNRSSSRFWRTITTEALYMPYYPINCNLKRRLSQILVHWG